MATVNEQLRDADIAHQVDLQGYSNGVVRRMIALLNRVDADLFVQLTAALEQLPPGSFTVERLEQLLHGVRTLNLQAYRALSTALTEELAEFSAYEAGHQYTLFVRSIPAQIIAQVELATVSAEQVYAAVMARPFQGKLLKGFFGTDGKYVPSVFDELEADKMARLRDAIRIGYVENQPVAKIVQRLRGTRSKGYSDGLVNLDRRHAEAVVRTAISHTAAFTRDRFLEANSSLIKAVVWTSTLDSRTSEGCRIRDGKQYTPHQHLPIGHKIPWDAGPGELHWNCRSTALPITKSWKELGGVDIESFSPTDRASMDGVVPADTTYAAWLGKQSAARQDEILGPSRGKLLRDGKLTLDRFYNDRGRFLSLEQMRKRDFDAFQRAGI